MTYRSGFIYLLVVAVFVGFYLFESRRNRLFSFQPEDLTRLVLRKQNQEIVLEKADGEEWEITAPVRTPADPFALRRITHALGLLKYQRIISKAPGDLTKFGLDPPDLLISYRAAGKEGTLAFGDKSRGDDGVYACKDTDPTVYLVRRPDKDDLDKTLEDLKTKESEDYTP